ALELRARIFGAFEMAELEDDPAKQRAWLPFAVIGAGPTGVEMAGRLAELSRRALERSVRRIDPATARVLRFDGGQEPAAPVGDMMSLNKLPGVAEVAMQSGMHAARTIKHRLRGDTASKPFVYRDLGSMATISRFRAIVSFKGIKVGGFIGWLIWAFVHLTF